MKLPSEYLACCAVLSHLVVSDSLRQHGLYPAASSVCEDSPGKNTGVVAMPSFGGSSQSRDQTQVSCIKSGFFTIWATREAHLAYMNPIISFTQFRLGLPLPWANVLQKNHVVRKKENLKIFGLTISSLDSEQNSGKWHIKLRYPMFIALLTIVRTWKQPRWIRKMWYIYTMEYNSAIKQNEVESVVVVWKN